MTTDKSSENKKNSDLQLPSDISRRDFVNGTLVGFGAALLSSSILVLPLVKSQLDFSMIPGLVLVVWATTLTQTVMLLRCEKPRI